MAERFQNISTAGLNGGHAERLLWQRLQDGQMLGLNFARHYMVAGYSLDFACVEQKFAIALDGAKHNDALRMERETLRDEKLREHGWRVLRFWNHELIETMEIVVGMIAQSLAQTPRA